MYRIPGIFRSHVNFVQYNTVRKFSGRIIVLDENWTNTNNYNFESLRYSLHVADWKWQRYVSTELFSASKWPARPKRGIIRVTSYTRWQIKFCHAVCSTSTLFFNSVIISLLQLFVHCLVYEIFIVWKFRKRNFSRT
jgi:hypothetical protein